MASNRCRGTTCRALIIWATFASSGKPVPMDPNPADPAARGAFIVIDGVAYNLAEARDRIMRSRKVINPDEADRIAVTEFQWHTSHFATCPEADEKRKAR